jgi:hypothetical protein
MTVTVVQRGDQHVSVRCDARIGEDAVTDAQTCQDYLAVLDKAIFLTLNRVDQAEKSRHKAGLADAATDECISTPR